MKQINKINEINEIDEFLAHMFLKTNNTVRKKGTVKRGMEYAESFALIVLIKPEFDENTVTRKKDAFKLTGDRE